MPLSLDKYVKEKLKVEGEGEICLPPNVLSQGFPRSPHDFQLTCLSRTISWRVNGQKVECSLRSFSAAVFLVALIENGETDFTILITKGRHKYLFAKQNSIKIVEVHKDSIKKINQLVKYYSYVQQQSRNTSQSSKWSSSSPQYVSQIARDQPIRERIKTSATGRSKESQDVRSPAVQVGSDCQNLPQKTGGSVPSLFSESAGRRNNDVSRESAEFFSRLCEGVSSESEIVERLEAFGNYLAEKERRGQNDIREGFQALKAEPGSIELAAVGQILAGIGAQNQAVAARGYTRQQLIYRRIEQLHQESTEHNRRVKEFYGSR